MADSFDFFQIPGISDSPAVLGTALKLDKPTAEETYKFDTHTYGWVQPVKGATAVTSPDDALRQRFQLLRQTWRDETMHLSSINAVAMHPAYQQIIGMGKPALPLILRALNNEGAGWFWALRCIAGFTPVPLSDQGNVPKMTAAWIAWGKRAGYL